MLTNNSNYDYLLKDLETKSDKIRALARNGVPTADIARYLGIRYQHARNVILKAKSSGQLVESPENTPSQSAAATLQHAWVELDGAGRLAIPSDLLEAAGVKGQDKVHLRLTDGGIEILSRAAALKRAQLIVSSYVPAGVSLADELIAQRREEAAHEQAAVGSRQR